MLNKKRYHGDMLNKKRYHGHAVHTGDLLCCAPR